MPLKVKVDYKDNSLNTTKELGRFIKRSVEKSAFLMEKEIKESATRNFTQRTGHLRRSVRANTEQAVIGSAEVQINPIREGADVNYALYLEYGTKYIAPRAFIRKGIGVAKQRIKGIFAEEAKRVVDNVRAGKK